jgi:hypothetical protein
MDRLTLDRLMEHSSPSVAARYYIHVAETHQIFRLARDVCYAIATTYRAVLQLLAHYAQILTFIT